MAPITIIGIDCATQPEKTGLALALWDGGPVVLRETACGSRHNLPAAIAARWLQGAERAVLALDAPLGWPLALGRELAHHAAGLPIDVDPTQRSCSGATPIASSSNCSANGRSRSAPIGSRGRHTPRCSCLPRCQ